MRSVLALIGKRWPLFLVGQFFMLVTAAAGLAFPWTVRNLFANVLGSDELAGLFLSIASLGAVLLLRDLAEYARKRTLGRVSEGIVYTLREQVYDALLTRSLSFFNNRSPGDISSVASNDINVVQAGLTVVLTNLVQQTVILLTVIVVLFFLDIPLAAVVFLFVPPLIAVSRAMAGRSAKTTAKRQRILGEIMSIVQQSVAGIEVIRSFLLEGAASHMHRRKNKESFATSLENVEITAASAFWSGVLGSCFLLAVMGFGGFRVVTGALTAPDLIAFILYSEMVTGPFVRLASMLPEIAKTRAAYSRIHSIFDAGLSDPIHTEPATRPVGSTEPIDGVGTIEFRNIFFSYDGATEVLRDISFAVDPGESIALVGPSGAGKSTILRLLPRLYDPDNGRILIADNDIRDIPIARLRASIGVVSQDPFIFDMSAGDNIRCGFPEASEEEVLRAAKLSHADEFIERLPEKYATAVGDGGSRLSGGQRQRIAIARAFLRNPPILLLDEATSALDGKSEAVVLDALDSLKADRTTLVIAHRHETIRDADRILVIDHGALVDQGSHRELLTRCALFGELYRAAARGAGSDPTPEVLRASR